MIKKMFILLVLLLVFFSIAFSKKLAALPDLMKPVNIEIDGKKIFMLDGVSVHVYSMSDYRLLTTFGKRGQGPGELVDDGEIPLHMRLVDGDIYLNSQTKIIQYSKEGRILKEKTFPFVCLQIVPLGEGFAVERFGLDGDGVISINVILYDARLKPVKTLTSLEKDDLSKKRRIVIPTPYIYLYRANDTLLVTGGNHRDFCIEVFDAKGNPLDPVGIPYQRLALTRSFEMELIEWLKTDSRFSGVPAEVFQRLHFLDPLPAIRNMVTDTGPESGGGRIYVQTYKQRNGLSEFFIFDFKGSLLKKTYLPMVSRSKVKMNHEVMFTFYNNKYYYLKENPDTEEWELHTKDLKGQ
jgi:hypothetical protein